MAHRQCWVFLGTLSPAFGYYWNIFCWYLGHGYLLITASGRHTTWLSCLDYSMYTAGTITQTFNHIKRGKISVHQSIKSITLFTWNDTIWGWMDGWMDRSMEGWMDRSMGGWIYRWKDGSMDGWIDWWVNGWMDGRTDGPDVYNYLTWIACISLNISLYSFVD